MKYVVKWDGNWYDGKGVRANTPSVKTVNNANYGIRCYDSKKAAIAFELGLIETQYKSACNAMNDSLDSLRRDKKIYDASKTELELLKKL